LDQHRIIYVIPRKNVETFQFQNDFGEIRQFVCLDEASVADMATLMNQREKKAWLPPRKKNDGKDLTAKPRKVTRRRE